MRRFRTLFVGSVIALSITALVLPAQAQSGTVTAQVDGSGFSTSTQTAQDVLDNRLLGAMGTVEVVVRLGDAPLTQALRARATNERTAASSMSRDQQQAYVADLERDQDGLLAQMQSLGAKEIGRLTHALNAVILSVDAAQLPTIAGMAGVTSVNPLVHYELADREVNDAIGATAAIESGVTGRGVKVAVFDSGIDYTHKELSGPGTLEAYARAYCGNEAATAPFSPACGTAYNNPAPADLFPSAKVYGGFDFVGEVWPNGPGGFSDADRSEDPNPLDLEGHGTHVADIVAGREGVAPNAQLLAVKVCSAVSGSCNGVALLKGVEFALDPNGDGSISDAVDVFNLSLSSSYGQIDDDLSLAVANATQLGVVVVASAGNQGDRPYIHGSPAATPGVIGVAQTTVPSASALFIKTPAIPTGVQVIPQSWAAAPIAQAAPLTYIATNLGTQRGCTDAQGTSPFTAGQLAGQIVLVDRGGCPISFKAANVARAGGVAMVLANNVAQGPFDPPPSFSFAGDDAAKTIPVYSITLAAGNLLKSNSLNQNAQVDPATAANVFGSVVTTSSRGPNNSFNAIKPDISAPGASVSAIAGSGTNREPFGGTSGAAPVVAGSAALLLEKFPEATPREVAARLMNTASPAIQINPAVAPGVLAPVARIGAGEVRPNAALNATTMAFAIDPIFNLPFASSFPASLSFGYHAVSEPITLRQRLLIQNLSDRPRSYTISSGFRSRNGTGVTLETPERVRIGPGGRRLVTVRLRIDPTDLPEWTMNGGVFGGDGFRLNGIPAGIPGVEAVPGLETDGYLTISSG
ncbi:MAG: S8 family serine peptidase, partial [Chloroflexaceae bacterium]|nr:S8 family serine peptidase [Chloroflexaceae bacterium]